MEKALNVLLVDEYGTKAKYDLEELNKLLNSGWKVKMAVPYQQEVSTGGSRNSTSLVQGIAGALVILEEIG